MAPLNVILYRPGPWLPFIRPPITTSYYNAKISLVLLLLFLTYLLPSVISGLPCYCTLLHLPIPSMIIRYVPWMVFSLPLFIYCQLLLLYDQFGHLVTFFDYQISTFEPLSTILDLYHLVPPSSHLALVTVWQET